MRLTCLAIDRVRHAPFRQAADEYLGRLRRYATVDERELKPTRGKRADGELRLDESTRLLAAVPDGAWRIVLDERGRALDSLAFARHLGEQRDLSRPVAFIIGGALGHDRTMRKQADLVLRLSSMTMAHELARVVLYEQIYRAMTILRGEPYHK